MVVLYLGDRRIMTGDPTHPVLSRRVARPVHPASVEMSDLPWALGVMQCDLQCDLQHGMDRHEKVSKSRQKQTNASKNKQQQAKLIDDRSMMMKI